MSLITLGRATELLPNFSSSDNSVMTDIIAACSDIIERYCNRTFAVTSYDELYDGTGDYNLLLNNYPVVSISRIAFFPQNVVMIQNTDATRSMATVRLDSTSLYLVWETNGVQASQTLTLASYPTLQNLATAISAVSGWSATALGNVFANYPTSFLHSPQGAYDVRWSGSCYLRLHTYNLFYFEQNPTIGEIVSPIPFSFGYQQYRVVYTAGFADTNGNTLIPNPIQQACAELAVMVYNNRNVNAGLQSENLGGYSYSRIAEASYKNLSAASASAIAQYKNHRVAKYKTF